MFDALVNINMGLGDKVLFLKDKWIQGVAAVEIAPLIVALVPTITAKRRTVRQALDEGSWVHDFEQNISFTALLQYMHLCQAINTVDRDPSRPDSFTWPRSPTGSYTAKSIYDYLCSELDRSPTAKCNWKSWAPLKCKLFVWLALQYRLWTSDRRARHGLQDHPSACYTCLQAEDSVDHILVNCTYAREVWHKVFHLIGVDVQEPGELDVFKDWWLIVRRSFGGQDRRGFDTMMAWALWKQRNARVFNRRSEQMTASELPFRILDEIAEWRQAGLGVGGLQ